MELIIIISVFNMAIAKVYTPENSRMEFEVFKRKYNKKYEPYDENKKFNNFIRNMNAIERLNTPEHVYKFNFKYAPNKYIDLNSAEMDDQYAIRIPCK